MFDVGWSEMALILMVALVVVGPKDLPRVARQIGKWTAKARSMGREFQRAFDDMAREAELQDLKSEIEKVSRTDMRAQIEKALDPDGELKRGLAPPSFEATTAKPAVPVAEIEVGEPPELAERIPDTVDDSEEAGIAQTLPPEPEAAEPRIGEPRTSEPKTAEKV